jgi:hypothetical protein
MARIETKYNIGDEVCFVLGSKFRQGIISGITFYKLGHTLINYYYNVQIGVSHGSFNESDLFPIKEELLKSL